MFTRSPKHLLTCIAMVCAFALTAGAQSLNDTLTAEADELRKIIDNSIKTSTVEDGVLKNFRVQVPNTTTEKVVTVEQGLDKRSFTMYEGGRQIKVALEEDGRISSIVFPDGRQAIFSWKMMPNGYWVATSIKVAGKQVSGSSFEAPDCYTICRNAAVATTIAIGTCIATGPLSSACWAATATAAYLTYACYECTYPSSELARTGDGSMSRFYSLANYENGNKKISKHYPGNRPDRRRCVSVRSE